MSIIGTLPNNIQNGQAEDATPVMANFNFIINQVNAAATPLGTFTAPAGTRMLFNQAAPPAGWTQEVGAAFNDTSVRTVTSAGGATAGSVLWSSWNFSGTFNVNSFALSVAQLPAHSHTVTDPGHRHGTGYFNNASGNPGTGIPAYSGGDQTTSVTTGITLQNTGSGAFITPTYQTPQVKFSDYIIGIKS